MTFNLDVFKTHFRCLCKTSRIPFHTVCMLTLTVNRRVSGTPERNKPSVCQQLWNKKEHRAKAHNKNIQTPIKHFINTYFNIFLSFLLTNRKQTACTTDWMPSLCERKVKWILPMSLNFILLCAQAVGGKKHWSLLKSCRGCTCVCESHTEKWSDGW